MTVFFFSEKLETVNMEISYKESVYESGETMEEQNQQEKEIQQEAQSNQLRDLFG